MCFSGGFALAAAVEPAVLAPVASQPSVPFPIGGTASATSACPTASATPSASGSDRGPLPARPPLQRGQRLAGTGSRAIEATFGPGWRAIPIDSSPGNPAGIGKREHSVLTSADVETPGHPTHEARTQVTEFLRSRLAAPHR